MVVEEHLEDPKAKTNMLKVITPNSPKKKLDNPA